jgi:hypothetical protein
MAIAARETREKKEWLFAPFGWAIFASLAAIAPMVYWWVGSDNPTSTILSLAFVILMQTACVAWGILRLRHATRSYR